LGARPFWGEGRVAVCVAREGADAVSEPTGGFPVAKVPRYKMPNVFLREALPKSGYGKIPKRLVRDELEARGLFGSDQARRIAMSVAKPNRPCPRRCATSPSPACRTPNAFQWVEARGRAFSLRSKPLCCWKRSRRFDEARFSVAC